MAEAKKSFLLYCDLIHTVEKMPNEKAGELLKHILEYVNDRNPVTEDLITQLTFEPIKQQLKRDLVKYESIKDRNRTNGSKGGRPKKPKETQSKAKKPSGLSGNPTEPKEPVSVNVSVSDSVNDNDIKISSIRILDTKECLDKLIKSFPAISIQEITNEIQSAKDWAAASGKRKKDWVAFMRNWLRKYQPKIDKHQSHFSRLNESYQKDEQKDFMNPKQLGE